MGLKLSFVSVRPNAAHEAAHDAMVEDYLKRCGRDIAASAKVFRTEKELLVWVQAEGAKGAAKLWIADPGGAALSSEQFAKRLGDARDNGTRHLAVAIGPADGWSVAARERADLRVSLGPMTLPHELARLILAEQIYRAATILQGHPYHLGH